MKVSPRSEALFIYLDAKTFHIFTRHISTLGTMEKSEGAIERSGSIWLVHSQVSVAHALVK